MGALLGIGGGVVLVPVLVLFLGVSPHQAVGTSLVAITATSLSSAAHYLRQGLTQVELAFRLEAFTAAGALLGAWIAGFLPAKVLLLAFAVLLGYTAFSMLKGKAVKEDDGEPRRVWLGSLVSAAAGFLSGTLGIGGGVLKVPIMHLLMGLPMRKTAATSVYMVGITASVGAMVYFVRGDIDPSIAGVAALGTFSGAFVGSRLMRRVPSLLLRRGFGALLVLITARMLWKALAG